MQRQCECPGGNARAGSRPVRHWGRFRASPDWLPHWFPHFDGPAAMPKHARNWVIAWVAAHGTWWLMALSARPARPITKGLPNRCRHQHDTSASSIPLPTTNGPSPLLAARCPLPAAHCPMLACLLACLRCCPDDGPARVTPLRPPPPPSPPLPPAPLAPPGIPPVRSRGLHIWPHIARPDVLGLLGV